MIVKEVKERVIKIGILLLFLYSNFNLFGQINHNCDLNLPELELIKVSLDETFDFVQGKIENTLNESKFINDSIRIINASYEDIKLNKRIEYEISFKNEIVYSYNFKIYFLEKNRKNTLKFFKQILDKIVLNKREFFIDETKKYSFYEYNEQCEKFFRLSTDEKGFYIYGGLFKKNY